MDKSGLRCCQPDDIIVDHSRKLILLSECKRSYTAYAFLQMVQLYVPCLQYIFPNYEIIMLQIVSKSGGAEFEFRYPQELFEKPEFGNYVFQLLT